MKQSKNKVIVRKKRKNKGPEKFRFALFSERNRVTTKSYGVDRNQQVPSYDPETGKRIENTPVAVKQIKKQAAPRFAWILRAIMLVFVGAVAGLLLYVLTGYAEIAEAYGDINELKSNIKEINLTLNALNAEIECAVTIEQAKAYAISQGMQYPTRNQYVQSGAAIPASAAMNANAYSAAQNAVPSDTGTEEGPTAE